MTADTGEIAQPLAARWEGPVVAASIAAVAGGAVLVGRWPLFAIVLVIQLAVTLAWLALTAVPASSGGLIIIVLAAVAADLTASRSTTTDQGPVAVVVAAALVLAVLRQLARRRRGRVAESLGAVMTGTVIVVFAAHLLSTRVAPAGVATAAAVCFSTAGATVVRRCVDAVIARPALRAGSGRGWPGLVLSVAAGAAVGAYVVADRSGLEPEIGGLIGLATALAAAAVDLGLGVGSLHLTDSRQLSAVAPLVVLLPLVVAAPVGYFVARLLAG